MNGQRIGYIRVSTVDQNTERQLALQRHLSGKYRFKRRRPTLSFLFSPLREVKISQLTGFSGLFHSSYVVGLDGIELDKTFTDKASGKDRKRPQLE